jgi:fatty acid desaturase
MQNYYPYRDELLTKQEIKDFSKLSFPIAFFKILQAWAYIIAIYFFLYHNPEIYWKVIAFPLIGASYYHLFIIGHDALHRRLHDNIYLNDLVTDMFIMAPVGAITRINRFNHMMHHNHTATDQDPDRFKYMVKTAFDMVIKLCGLNSIKAIKNVFSAKKIPSQMDVSRTISYKFRDIVFIISWQLLINYLLIKYFGWYGSIMLWYAPVFVGTILMDIVRVFCEHSMFERDDKKADATKRLVHIKSSWLERFFFAPNHMNCHVAHHLYMSIPFYRLPKAEALVLKRAQEKSYSEIEIRSSYLSHLVKYFKFLKG